MRFNFRDSFLAKAATATELGGNRRWHPFLKAETDTNVHDCPDNVTAAPRWRLDQAKQERRIRSNKDGGFLVAPAATSAFLRGTVTTRTPVQPLAFSFSPPYTPKEEPHPQLSWAFGFKNANPPPIN